MWTTSQFSLPSLRFEYVNFLNEPIRWIPHSSFGQNDGEIMVWFLGGKNKKQASTRITEPFCKYYMNGVLVLVWNIFCLYPYLGRWFILTNIFQSGWNHQLVKLRTAIWRFQSGILFFVNRASWGAVFIRFKEMSPDQEFCQCFLPCQSHLRLLFFHLKAQIDRNNISASWS